MPTLLLCSGSPRRRDFLAALGIPFEVVPPGVDETRRIGEDVGAWVERLAREKAEAGLRRYTAGPAARPGPCVALGADTVVVGPGGEVLEKPRDRADAIRMLRLLSGAEHRVTSAVCVVSAGARTRVVETSVRFRPLTEEQLRWLAASGDGDDKAGAYAAQGLAGAFIDRLEGSFTNVVGLPLSETIEMLETARIPMPWSAR